MSQSPSRRRPNADGEDPEQWLRMMEKLQCPATFSTEPYDEDSIILEEAAEYGIRDIAGRSSTNRLAFRLLFFTDMVALFINLYVSNTLVRGITVYKSPFIAGYKRFAFATLLCQFIFSVIESLPSRHTVHGKWRNHLLLRGDNVPAVDVVITCCNENPNIILNTVRAALALDYPSTRFRVIVTDDGNSPTVASRISALAAYRPNLFYTARKKNGPAGFKAGNLNHAVRFVTSLPQGPAEMVAGLDADMIPEKRWLRAIVAHLVHDAGLGLACPPQHFYNFPPNDPLSQTMFASWRYDEIVRDMEKGAWCTGSGWVVRRQAIDDVGGFPLESLTEDVYFSILLRTVGWKTAYITDAVQYGLVPETYFGHLKQFTRWHLGGVQIGMQLNFGLDKKRCGKLTIDEKLSLFLHHWKQFMCLGQLVGHVLLSTNVLFDTQLLSYIRDAIAQDPKAMRQILRVQSFLWLVTWSRHLQRVCCTGYLPSVQHKCMQIWMTPYYARSIMEFLLSSWKGNRHIGFTASGSIETKTNERQVAGRAPLRTRIRTILIDHGAWFHLLLATMNFAGIVRKFCCHWYPSGTHPGGAHSDLYYIEILSIPSFQLMLTYLVPILYAVFPPTVADHSILLKLDPESGVRYPTEKARQASWKLAPPIGYVQLHLLLVLYVLGLFVSTWRS